MNATPPPDETCTCGCKSKDLSLTIDGKRWFVDKTHLLTFIRQRETKKSTEHEEKVKPSKPPKKSPKKRSKSPSKKKKSKSKK